MKKRYYTIPILVLSIIIFLNSPALSWFTKGYRGRTSGKFLSIPVEARDVALGNAVTSVTNYNPAILSEREINFSQAILWERVKLSDFCYSTKKISYGIKALYMDRIKEIDISWEGEPIFTGKTFSPYDLSLSVGYVFKDYGVRGKLVYEYLYPGYDDVAVCIDLGWHKQVKKLSLGFAIKNLGTELWDSPLPLLIATGVSYSRRNFLTSMDFKFPNDNTPYVCCGLEYQWKMLIGRIGYEGNLETLNLGMGLRIGSISMDYGIVLLHALQETHRISVSHQF